MTLSIPRSWCCRYSRRRRAMSKTPNPSRTPLICTKGRKEMIMSTSTPVTNRSPFEGFRQRGYFFQYTGVLTLIMGIYIHLTRLFIGTDLVIQKVITPELDMLLALPMFYTTLFGWLAWKR